MRNLARLGFIASTLLATACGEDLACPQPPMMLISAPLGDVATDTDPATDGVQVTVRARTTLPVGATATLRVLLAGTELATAETTVDALGDVAFADVTVPTGALTLEVRADESCGVASDSRDIRVLPSLACGLVTTPAPVANTFYAPLLVWNGSTDLDPATSQHDVRADVITQPGAAVEIYRVQAGIEALIATVVADDLGAAGVALALDQGAVELRARCRGDGAEISAAPVAAWIDTVAPSCALTSPSPGSSITPGYDLDGDLANGIQLNVIAQVDADDALDTLGQFEIDLPPAAPLLQDGSLVDATGQSQAVATLAPAALPATLALRFLGTDRAGNACADQASYPVVLDGCEINVVSPSGVATVDVDGDEDNGAQLDVVLAVETACAGQLVTSTCADTTPTVVPANGALTMRATVCATSPCEADVSCQFAVTSVDDVTTSAGWEVRFDNAGPLVEIAVTAPAVACGATLVPADDIDAATPGVQVEVAVTTDGLMPRLRWTSTLGTQTLAAATPVVLTLTGGVNQLVGQADDVLGNLGASRTCTLTLDDVTVSFSPPIADGWVGRRDGTVSGNALTLPLCGTVSTTGAQVSVSVDGVAAAATVTGTTWCRPATLSTGASHIVIAQATVPGGSQGAASLILQVDLTVPPALTDLAVTELTRQHLRAGWTAIADGPSPARGYEIRVAQVALTEANFDQTGALATPAAQAAGTAEQFDVEPARTGTAFWIGVATVDIANNRSAASIIGPVTPDFEATPALTGAEANFGAHRLGYALASGDFNGDGRADVAAGAPGFGAADNRTGRVLVYFGTATGLPATPNLIIDGPAPDARFGSGLAAVRWTGAGFDDLAIGAPGAAASDGTVYVFTGGASLGTGVRGAASAERRILVDTAQPAGFTTGELGARLAAGHLDLDSIPDLAIAAPGHDGGRGAIAIVYGASATAATIALSADVGALAGAEVRVITDPAVAPGRRLGSYLHVVSPGRDGTDDVIAALADDINTAGDDAIIWWRGPTTAPGTPGLVAAPLDLGRDARVTYANPSVISEFGAQITTVGDVNADGRADLAVAAYRANNNAGQVLLLDGDVAGAVSTSDAGVTATTLTGSSGARLGAVLVHGQSSTGADLDADGLDDLLIGAVTGGIARLHVWFGDALPTGSSNLASADTTIDAPTGFILSRPGGGSQLGAAGQAIWTGDVDGDGLPDLMWSSPNDQQRDGLIQLLYN